jgi:hypothetical protein
MAFSWDGLVAVVIIVGLILAVWAKISQQTIVELLTDIKDMLQDKKEDAQSNLEYANLPTI